MNLKTFLKGAVAGIAAALLGYAVYAQVIPIPQVTNVGATDLFQDITSGNAQAPESFATAAQIAGVPGYTNLGVLASGTTQAFGNATTNLVAQSSGTIAALTLTAAPNPGDGQTNCYFNTQITTAITWNANSTINTQTISGAPSAGVANTKYCMLFSKALGGWVRVQ